MGTFFISTSRTIGKNITVTTAFCPASFLALITGLRGRGDYLAKELAAQCFVRSSSQQCQACLCHWVVTLELSIKCTNSIRIASLSCFLVSFTSPGFSWGCHCMLMCGIGSDIQCHRVSQFRLFLFCSFASSVFPFLLWRCWVGLVATTKHQEKDSTSPKNKQQQQKNP